MLVLTRKENEKILIGDDIVVTVVRAGERVRIGIDAPNGVTILREELAEKPDILAAEKTELKKAG